MRLRSATVLIVGAALAFDAAIASAQARSARRIPISKEGGGEVVLPPRTDTVTVYRTDTLRLFRTDTVTSYRVDTVRVEPVAPIAPMPSGIRQIGGLYFGLDAGAAVPTGNFSDGQTGGPHFGAQLGWDPIGSPVGARLDGSFSRFDVRSAYEGLSSSPTIWQFGGDLKLRLPVLSPWMRRFQIYGVGGASYNRFKDLVEIDDIGIPSVGDVVSPSVATADHGWHDEWGWNAGGGVQAGWGRMNVFVESRLMRFNHRIDINQVPIVLGLSWY
jgi:hypothetical protein